MLATTLGQLIVNEALPPDLRDYTRVLDKKSTNKLLKELAEKHPDKYRDAVKKLNDIGAAASTESGGFSFSLDNLSITPRAKKVREEMKQEVNKIYASKIPQSEKNKKIVELLTKRSKEYENTIYEEALENGNPLALQVLSGARGNPGNLRSILGGDLLYENHKGEPVPIPIINSYAKGLSPVEYFAATAGARKGVADLKFATMEAGYFGKQLAQAAHRLLVGGLDRPDNDKRIIGMPVDTMDPENEGTLLAKDMGGYKKNTTLTPKILADLNNQGYDKILIRSPITIGMQDGRLYARDVGVRERGILPKIGENIGLAAATSLSEPVSQAQISSKHSGGVSGAGSQISGFKYINQLTSVPKVFTSGATHSQLDGKVGLIFPAPAGGHFVFVNGQKHYVGVDSEVKVKPGDTVEAGDVLSTGLLNPAEIVKHKGLGEGRRYFTNILRDTYKASNIPAHRRNIELLARGLINHVQLTDEVGDYVMDDIVPYNIIEHQYKPRQGHVMVEPKRAVNHYLEQPVLHYTVGTQIKPSMLDNFKRFEVDNLVVHKEPPPFKPIMVRAMDNLLYDPDWMTRHLGTSLRKGMLESAHRGLVSDELGTSYVPALARGVDFGRIGATKGWSVDDE